MLTLFKDISVFIQIEEISMLKRILTTMALLGFCLSLFAGGDKEEVSQAAAGKKNITIEVVATQPEYLEQDKQIWAVYMEENPGINIKVTSLNEDQQTAFLARMAANEGPAIMSNSFPSPDKSTYKSFVNLLNIDYPYWDQLSYDGKKLFETETGVKDYVPVVQLFNTYNFSFIYYKDEMQKAGLDPSTIRTWDDLDNFLADLKSYVDKTKGLDYVLDTGWHSWVWGLCYPNILALSMGADPKAIEDLYLGKIAWTDINNNPLVPFFKKLKDYQTKGYFPKNWLGRDWENEYESGFINRKSIFTLHGPWLWDKVLAADPSAQLDGLPFPAGKDGKLAAYPVTTFQGASILSQYEGTENFNEIVKAFNWYNSPEAAEMRAQFNGSKPNFKSVSSSFTINSPQYIKVIKPAMDGAFGKGISWDNSTWGVTAAGPYKIEGKAEVLMDDNLTEFLGKYFNSELTLEQLMAVLQERWENAYNL